MSIPSQPVPVQVVPDARPTEVVIISHSPLFYWWPVWAVGFLVAAVSYWQGDQMAFVPPGTKAESGARVEGQDGTLIRDHADVLIAPKNASVKSGIIPRTVVMTTMHTGRILLVPPSRMA